ncbi:MAG: ATP-dependent Clp protease ATP-binding subunit [Aureispira sp.]|nr:ATP-dependent Clp protease ATP-binding subunit [Aureispira sp.]
MSKATINVPVLVQNIKVDENYQYYIRPLFFPNPVATHRRYEVAVSYFKQAVRSHFKGFELQRYNANQLLWYTFNPKMNHRLLKMEFIAGKQTIRGKFSVVTFKLQDITFVCLPTFSSYVFMVEKEFSSKKQIAIRTREVIEGLLRDFKKGANTDTWDMEPHYSAKGEFTTLLEFNVNVDDGKFGFESDSYNWMYALFGGAQDFSGEVEIEKVGVDLNELYPTNLKRAFEREDLVKQLTRVVYQKENTPIVLVGGEGVGKSSLVQEVVYRYKTSNKLQNANKLTKFWHIDPTRIIAGMSIVGMWQKRFESILQHVQERLYKEHKIKKTDKILIDNVVAMLRIGKSASNNMTLSDVLRTYLEKRLIQVVVVATPEEWKIIQEKDRRFADLFQVIRVQEPSRVTAVKMILEQRKLLEIENECNISVPAVRQLFTIQRNYFKRKSLPGSVAKLLNQLTTKYKFRSIDVEEVQQEFRQYSGLNMQMFDDAYVFEDQEVRKNIEASLIGQPEAVTALTSLVHVIKAKLTNPNKPLGSFLFIGPTGVGKTEAAKILCRYLLGNEDKLMRFDMNEYIDESALSRLIGDYYNPEGQLTGKIRYNPFGVLLFDEIEKAHPKVHDLLLQVLDDGRLTDSLGRTVDFANTIIIMTSNIGAQQVDQKLGFETIGASDNAIYNKAVENFFRPEFINRIGKIIIFNSLELQNILEIAKLQIQNLLKRDGFVRRTTILNISTEALEWVARRGYNSKMGGRALRRQIEKDLTAFTADQLVRTRIENPVIFDISLKDGKLAPRIQILDFVEPLLDNWLPNIPEEKRLKPFYGFLLRELEQIEDEIKRLEERWDEEDEEEDEDELIVIDADNKDSIDWQYYEFKNQIADKKEHFNRILLGFRSKYLDNIATNAFRLKTSTSSIIYNRPESTSKIDRILMKDKLFQKSALDELRYVYQNSPDQFDRQQSAYLEDLLDMAFMKLRVGSMHKNEPDKVAITISSTISNQGDDEIEFLQECYVALLDHLDIGFKKIDNKIEAEDHGLYTLLSSEHGFHLFYRSHQNPLPIQVEITKEGKNDAEMNPHVIRLYDIWLGKENKASTVTDLRTGFTNQATITSSEFKLFLYAGLSTDYRLEYNRN